MFFEDLDEDLRQRFLATELPVAMIETGDPNEALDLFICLQAGMPLNAQEKRDAWPGDFTDFILRVAGKTPTHRGHDFFREVMKATEKNRGDFRQLAAQLVMLLLAHRDTGGEKMCAISRVAVDNYYYKHLDFDAQSPEATRVRQVLDLLTQLLRDGKRPKVIKHEAIHLALLVDGLMDEYTRGWTATFAEAFDRFREEGTVAKKARYEIPTPPYWARYGQWTRTSSDSPHAILQRHHFFIEKMHRWLQPQLKDPIRIFGPLERELIYYRDKKHCQVPSCGAEVTWSDHEIHHVEQHCDGGRTTIENGALVHKACHPKTAQERANFAERWHKKRAGLPE
jgi:HNH endonuclease